ncbi:MAG: hypothetical protein ACR2PW_05740 [Gammaproteobacteria bacterium]
MTIAISQLFFSALAHSLSSEIALQSDLQQALETQQQLLACVTQPHQDWQTLDGHIESISLQVSALSEQSMERALLQQLDLTTGELFIVECSLGSHSTQAGWLKDAADNYQLTFLLALQTP